MGASTPSIPPPQARRTARILRWLGLIGMVFYAVAGLVPSLISFSALRHGDATFPQPLGNTALFAALCLGLFLFSFYLVMYADRTKSRT